MADITPAIHYRAPNLSDQRSSRECRIGSPIRIKAINIPRHIAMRPPLAAKQLQKTLGSHDCICAGTLTLVETLDEWIIAPSKFRGFHIGPTQVFIAILVVTLVLLLAVTESLTANTPTIGRIVTHLPVCFQFVEYQFKSIVQPLLRVHCYLSAGQFRHIASSSSPLQINARMNTDCC